MHVGPYGSSELHRTICDNAHAGMSYGIRRNSQSFGPELWVLSRISSFERRHSYLQEIPERAQI
jgi:hypothetical protein